MLELLLFFLGFYLLVRGAEWLVDSAAKLADKIGLNHLLIGLTVVAFGTSLPELVVNLFASEAGSSELVVGNIIGTNIANTLLILGIAALVVPLTVHRKTVWREILFNLAAAGMLVVLAADAWILDNGGFNGLDRIDGLVLMGYFFIFMYYAFGHTTFTSHRPRPLLSKKAKKPRDNIVPNSILMILAGSVAMFFGGKWIVEGALFMAEQLNINESVIGLSVVAIGTSLPELAAALTALKKKNVDMAVGTVVGSNLFNIFWVLGLSATLHSIEFSTLQLMDALVGLGVAFILFVSVAYGRHKHQISRFEARIFLTLYALYLLTLPFR